MEDKNLKRKASQLSDPVLEASLLRQIEYYFSDSNLPRDKFLREKIRENEGGWVPVAIFTKFNRVKILTEDPATIAKALKSSKELLEVSDDNLNVRRKTPLPTNLKHVEERTIYAKGFKTEETIDSITRYFEKEHGSVRSVHLRKKKISKDWIFKGSCLVEFKNKELAVSALQKKFKYFDSTLFTQSRNEFMAEKEEQQARRPGRPERSGRSSRPTFNPARFSIPTERANDRVIKLTNVPADVLSQSPVHVPFKDCFSAFGKVEQVLVKKQERIVFVRYANNNGFGAALIAEQVVKAGKKICDVALKKVGDSGTDIAVSAVTGDEETKFWDALLKPSWPKDRVIKLTNLPGDAFWRPIREAFEPYGGIGFVEHIKATNTGFVRFQADNGFGAELIVAQAIKAEKKICGAIFATEKDRKDGQIGVSVAKGADEARMWANARRDGPRDSKRKRF